MVTKQTYYYNRIMNFEYTIKSPCKINLSLDVHQKREDGFHDLTSIFQLVSLEDTISGRINNSGEINIKGDFNCHPQENLIYKATKLFLSIGKIDNGIDYNVTKVIPSGGGIGGGSSNCAATLRLLNYIYPNRVSPKGLFNIALQLGSDVPFFLGDGTALVEGRGEVITPLKTIKDYYILLINPGIHISTKEAFHKLHEKVDLNNKSEEFSNNITKIYNKGFKKFSIYKNSFELALFRDYTFINEIKVLLNSEGSLHSSLSGSGSTMFGIFDNLETAQKAKNRISNLNLYTSFLVEPLEEFPKIEKRVFK